MIASILPAILLTVRRLVDKISSIEGVGNREI